MSAHSFYSGGSKLAAKLYSKSDGTARRKPGIIVIGSWLTVKEQMSANYAPLLAEAGLAALTFDFRGFGTSEGAPREVESGRAKAEDILNAAAFLRTLPEIDPDRIGVLAICASAGYTALALQGAAASGPIKTVTMVAPWIHDRAIVAQLYGGEAAVAERLAAAEKARSRYATTGEVEYLKAASNIDSSAAMYWEGDALDYYLNPKRGAIPEWGGRFALMAWKEWLEMDFVALAGRLAVPVRIVSSEGSATPTGAKAFADGLRGKHDVVWTRGTQFQFYDDPETVRFSADRAIEHFAATLA